MIGVLLVDMTAANAKAEQPLELYPDLLLSHNRADSEGSQEKFSARLDWNRYWFQSSGSACKTAFDTLAMIWLATRMTFICPYSIGRTTLGAEITPEIQWPTGESVGENPRPGVKISHLQNTRLSSTSASDLEYFFKLSYKIALQERQSKQAPSVGSRVVSAALVQDWSDLMDSTFQTGLIFLTGKNTQAEQSAVFISFEQTLPLSLRELGVLTNTAQTKWSKLEASYRSRHVHFLWGAGLAYGNLSFDWIQISGLFPVFYFAYDLGQNL